MEFENLGRAWRRQDEAAGSRKELDVVRDKVREMDRLVRARDRVETGLALLMLPLFAWLAVEGRGEVSRIGAGLIAAACVLVPVRLRAARRANRTDPSRPVLEALKADLQRVRAQERLLAGVLWWYLAPLGLGVILFVAGAGPSLWNRVLYPLVVVGFFGWLWYRNQQVVRRDLRPQAQELEGWIGTCEEK